MKAVSGMSRSIGERDGRDRTSGGLDRVAHVQLGVGAARGEPNAWLLTASGWRALTVLDVSGPPAPRAMRIRGVRGPSEAFRRDVSCHFATRVVESKRATKAPDQSALCERACGWRRPIAMSRERRLLARRSIITERKRSGQ
jgi:hypothetical protein